MKKVPYNNNTGLSTSTRPGESRFFAQKSQPNEHAHRPTQITQQVE